jgi:superfamily II DNA helicase RecQ
MSQCILKSSAQRVAPIGTRHIKRKTSLKVNAFPAKTPAALAAELASRLEELRTLPELIKQHFKTWENGARDFQLQAMEAQVLGRDVFLHAATGSGKTGIAAGPHLLPSNKGKVTLFISPLLSLHAEQVSFTR